MRSSRAILYAQRLSELTSQLSELDVHAGARTPEEDVAIHTRDHELRSAAAFPDPYVSGKPDRSAALRCSDALR
jgi:hypothetical protein